MKNIYGLLAIVFLFGGYSFADQPRAMGNVSLYKTVFPPTSQVTVSTMVPISPTASFLLVNSTGGVVNFTGSSGAWPAISTSTALNGQFLTLASTNSASIVVIETGTVSAVIGDNKFIQLSSTMSAVSFIYSSTLSQWLEIGKQ